MTSDSGCEPLTPDDIAEIVVFAAGRRENVVVADTLVFPNHQVRDSNSTASWKSLASFTPLFQHPTLVVPKAPCYLGSVADCLIKAAATVMHKKS